MQVGASYYPELFSKDLWETHLSTAKAIGLTVLRCGEFSWSVFQPKTDQFNPEWAKPFLDMAHRFGFSVIWCTPSATPPPWVFDRFDDLHAVNCQGDIMPVGIRRHYCPSHGGYQQLCTQMAGQLAQHLSDHPAIMGWQVDNELAGDGFTCWCNRCHQGFINWLKNRYQNLDALNEAWQTRVWSQVYTRWQQIPIPHARYGSHAPSVKLDYLRFKSDCWLNFYRLQADALRKHGAQKVTTNFFDMTWDVPFDLGQWADQLDAVGISQYDDDVNFARFELALLNGVAQGRPLWVLEQKAAQQTAQSLATDNLHERLTQHLSRCAQANAKVAVYWHLVQHSAGCEQEHGAVLRHDGKPGPVAHAISKAIEQTRDIQPTDTRPACTLLFDYPQQWAQQTRASHTAKWSYFKALAAWHAATVDLNWQPAITLLKDIDPQTLKLLLMPHWQMHQPAIIDVVRQVLDSGNTVITTADAFSRDQYNNILRKPPLDALTQLGITPPDGQIIQLADQQTLTGKVGQQPIEARHFFMQANPITNPIGQLNSMGIIGPAAMRLPHDQGQLIVVNTILDAPSLKAMLMHLAHSQHTDLPNMFRVPQPMTLA